LLTLLSLILLFLLLLVPLSIPAILQTLGNLPDFIKV